MAAPGKSPFRLHFGRWLGDGRGRGAWGRERLDVKHGTCCCNGHIAGTADCLAREKRDGTLGLLFLTPLRAGDHRVGTLLTTLPPTRDWAQPDADLLEHARNVVVLPASFDWDDVGAWPAVARHRACDSAGNVQRGNTLVEQGSGNIVLSEGRHLVTVLGADNLIVVHTPDATLVCPRDRAQDIKALLKRLAADPAGCRLL